VLIDPNNVVVNHIIYRGNAPMHPCLVSKKLNMAGTYTLVIDVDFNPYADNDELFKKINVRAFTGEKVNIKCVGAHIGEKKLKQALTNWCMQEKYAD